ncbi:proline-rich protein HaeIII subfamily 1-like [Penaeus chinensis]|uniref:proline-rich protein HaeIII subfamily 1-like n=1 Tax=Penaeus chinensis TaxID=139456 RepID=UPI001FB846B9|nr:proline-rich protein HaeIII subfamily 1-like [Penaeus chinensis]
MCTFEPTAPVRSCRPPTPRPKVPLRRLAPRSPSDASPQGPPPTPRPKVPLRRLAPRSPSDASPQGPPPTPRPKVPFRRLAPRSPSDASLQGPPPTPRPRVPLRRLAPRSPSDASPQGPPPTPRPKVPLQRDPPPRPAPRCVYLQECHWREFDDEDAGAFMKGIKVPEVSRLWKRREVAEGGRIRVQGMGYASQKAGSGRAVQAMTF